MFSVILPLHTLRLIRCPRPIRQPLPPLLLVSPRCISRNYSTWRAGVDSPQTVGEQDIRDEVGNQARGGLPRIFVDDLPAFQGAVHTLQGPELVHVVKVLRLGPDSRLELFDGNGGLVTAAVVEVGKSSCQLSALHSPQRLSPAGPQWTVVAACGSLKGGRADWLVEKCTELGAAVLIPLLTQRSPRASEGRTDRWERVGLAAAKQCQRLHTMRVREPMTMEDLCQEGAIAVIATRSFLRSFSRSFLGSFSSLTPERLWVVSRLTGQMRAFPCALLAAAHSPPLLAALAKREEAVAKGGMMIVGPEGDFTREETEQLLALGAIPVGLGRQRLRVETASVAMLATLMLLGDRLSEEN